MSPFTSTNSLKNIAGWFTDSKRQAIQAALVAVMPVIAYFGWVNGAQSDAIVSVIQVVLQIAQGVVGLALLRKSDAAQWIGTTGRGLLYALAGVVGPLGVAFQWWGDGTAAGILTIAGLALTALAAFVQVVNAHTLTTTTPDVDPSELTD